MDIQEVPHRGKAAGNQDQLSVGERSLFNKYAEQYEQISLF